MDTNTHHKKKYLDKQYACVSSQDFAVAGPTVGHDLFSNCYFFVSWNQISCYPIKVNPQKETSILINGSSPMSNRWKCKLLKLFILSKIVYCKVKCQTRQFKCHIHHSVSKIILLRFCKLNSIYLPLTWIWIQQTLSWNQSQAHVCTSLTYASQTKHIPMETSTRNIPYSSCNITFHSKLCHMNMSKYA
jgi:hypothetical protein